MAWISFGALPCRKKKTWQLASQCCWNRARPCHASELVSFLIGLRTCQHPGNSVNAKGKGLLKLNILPLRPTSEGFYGFTCTSGYPSERMLTKKLKNSQTQKFSLYSSVCPLVPICSRRRTLQDDSRDAKISGTLHQTNVRVRRSSNYSADKRPSDCHKQCSSNRELKTFTFKMASDIIVQQPP